MTVKYPNIPQNGFNIQYLILMQTRSVKKKKKLSEVEEK